MIIGRVLRMSLLLIYINSNTSCASHRCHTLIPYSSLFRSTALQTLRLLLHQRRRPTRAGAALMPMAQGMADFVVDQVLPVLDDVVEFLGRRDPALGVEDDVGPVAARELAEGAQGQAHLVDGVGTGDGDHRVLPVVDEFDGDVVDVLPAAFVL